MDASRSKIVSLDKTWPAALNLRERKLLRQKNPDISSDIELGTKRIAAWDSGLLSIGDQPKSLLGNYLNVLGLSQPEAIDILGIDPEFLAVDVAPPKWVERIQASLDCPALGFELDFEAAARHVEPADFMPFIRAFALHAAQRVFAHTKDLNLDGKERVISSALKGLIETLLTQSARVLLVEFQARNLSRQLEGETDIDRYQAFLKMLDTATYRADLLGRFPVLARRLDISCENWVRATALLIQRLDHDWDALIETFHFSKDSQIEKVEGDSGDKHKGGLSVVVVHLNDGQRVVYKPRSIEVERRVHDVFRAANKLGVTDLKTWALLERSDYGWVEFLSTVDCTTQDQIKRYYVRVGHLLAVMNFLGAVDLHHENMLALGEFPAVIDFETILSPPLELVPNVYAPFVPLIRDSVVTTGLIPVGQESSMRGLSGIADSDKGGQMISQTLQKVGTNEMRYERTLVQMEDNKNIIRLNGKPVYAATHLKDIIAGFEAAYRSLADGLSTGALNEVFDALSGVDIRILIRNTKTYAVVLSETAHPTLLRDAFDLEKHFSQLISPNNISAFLEKVLLSELDDLQSGDVPWFGAKPTEADIFDARGKSISGVLQRSGWDHTKERLSRVGEMDLAQQIDFIASSFFLDNHDLQTVQSIKDDRSPTTLRHRDHISVTGATRQDRLLSACSNVVTMLRDGALQSDKHTVWLSLATMEGPAFSGLSLERGIAGIALFLAEYDRVTGTETDLTAQAANTFLAIVNEFLHETESTGGYSGNGGALWVGSRLHQLGIFDLRPHLPNWLNRTQKLIEHEAEFDIYSGLAGLGLSCLSVECVFPGSGALRLATECAERLMREAIQLPDGGAVWPSKGQTPSPENPAFAGFSHGSSGFALFLSEYARFTQNDQFLALANAALIYERSAYSPEHGNWERFRPESEFDGERVYQVAWCHGAAGIGLTRKRLLQLGIDYPEGQPLSKSALSTDFEIAKNAILERRHGGNHTLCHGRLGNCVIGLNLTSNEDDPQRVLFESTIDDMIEEIGSGNVVSDMPFGIIPSGFLTGLAGMGYGLLQSVSGVKMPDAMSLELL
ncbi:type 2 lantibiotic biosynthesis protein LanM [Maritalea mobilis]|uniref:Type 2 lantibiotic biosynthesis protein LanM n=1 Tax=Maritalea mobilis TaxID=483324 RepID=A0A4R6VQ58_9HYPH|nr:type 2 lanthipeptide synthetase LanM [Maritalea mobilis]TDQ64412.1 type 2 lantibiotic biosynthesis protein LanM [Maritalea mobilis]